MNGAAWYSLMRAHPEPVSTLTDEPDQPLLRLSDSFTIRIGGEFMNEIAFIYEIPAWLETNNKFKIRQPCKIFNFPSRRTQPYDLHLNWIEAFNLLNESLLGFWRSGLDDAFHDSWENKYV